MGFFFGKSSKKKTGKVLKANKVAKDATIHPLEKKDQPELKKIKPNAIAVAPTEKQENTSRKAKVRPNTTPHVHELQKKEENVEHSNRLIDSENKSRQKTTDKENTEKKDETSENANHKSSFENAFKELCADKNYFTEESILKRKNNGSFSPQEKLQAHLIQFLYFKDCKVNTETGKRKVYIDHYKEKLLSILSLPVPEILGIVYDFFHYLLSENHGEDVDKETKTKPILEQLCKLFDLPCAAEIEIGKVQKLMEKRGEFVRCFAMEAEKTNKLSESIEALRSAKHIC